MNKVMNMSECLGVSGFVNALNQHNVRFTEISKTLRSESKSLLLLDSTNLKSFFSCLQKYLRIKKAQMEYNELEKGFIQLSVHNKLSTFIIEVASVTDYERIGEIKEIV